MAFAVPMLRDLMDRTTIPVVSTLKGLGAIPTNDPLFLGMLGMHGTRAANIAVQDTDLLIALGARFDDRATGKLSAFAPQAKVIHVDIDAAEINKLRAANVGITGDLKTVLANLKPDMGDISAWVDTCLTNKKTHAFRYDAPGKGVYAPALLKLLSEKAGDKFMVACDVGQHQMWVAQHCQFLENRAHLTSGGSGRHGLRPAGGRRRQAGQARHARCHRFRRRQFHDEHPGDGDPQPVQHPAEDRPARQQLPRAGASVAGTVLPGKLFGNRPVGQSDFVVVAQAFNLDAFRITHRHEVEGRCRPLAGGRSPYSFACSY
ncbi:MAG: hypothetical protein WDN06_08095 [Asticcacaulis sp.]